MSMSGAVQLDELQAGYLDILNASPYMRSILQPGRRAVEVAYYCYNGQIGNAAVPLAPLVPQSVFFDTQADSDFAVTFMAAAVIETTNGAAMYNDNVAIQFTDTSTGKSFFNVPTVMGLVTGGGGFPYVLPAPRVIRPNTTLQVTAINRDTIVNGGAGPVSLYWALHGTRIFYG